MADRRIALTVQYDGTDYAGMQRQPNALTVQAVLEEALEAVLGHAVRITGASRTDAGVHALGQVVTFSTDSPIPLENLPRALNDRLPVAVNVMTALAAPGDFHPRFSAVGKLYSYRVLNRPLGSPFMERYAWHVPQALDDAAMRKAAQVLVGQHDFAAFCAAGSAVSGTVRTLRRADCERTGDVLDLRFEGDGFLYMMVRIMVGTLVEVGLGRIEPDALAGILASGDRARAGPTAPPQGLCLVRVDY